MIKKLYWQIVLTFLGSVLLSLILAFTIADHLYRQDRLEHINNEITALSKEVASAYQAGDREGAKQSLNLLSKLDVKSVIYKGNGEIEYSNTSRMPDGDAIQKVLNGGMYRGNGNIPQADERFIGYPFKIAEDRYALFISPNAVGFLEDFRRVLTIILMTILVVGSVLFLLSSRFITKPIQQLTKASLRVAKGDFDIQLKTRRKDELGNLTDSFNEMARELGELDSMRKQFVADVSHEIQSPLTSIRGFAKALKDGVVQDEAERQEYLGIIEAESKRLSDLSQNLLKLAALESEHPPFQPEVFNLDEHIRRIAASFEPQWKAKNQAVELKLEAGNVSGDPQQLSQVWVNLLSNAICYTDEGGEISITAKSGENRAVIRFSDNGAGISEKDQEKMFRRFYKSDKSRSREKGGNGLGLAIVKRIIDLHDGEITVRSRLGEGTAVEVQLFK